jgi:sulfide:quinone oxidoreductase
VFILSKKVLIVGGGPGGCMTANRLGKSMRNKIREGQLEITLLSNTPNHIYEAGFLFMSLDLKNPEQFTREQKDLLDPAVNLIVDPARKIDVQNSEVTTESGRSYRYDILLIATGSEVRPDITPGMKEGGQDFYTLEGTAQLRDKLVNFHGGKILCAVEMPHKCPVSFLEILFMLHDFYKRKGIRDKVELAYTYPFEVIHQRPEIAKFTQPLLDECGIKYHTAFGVSKVDPAAKKVFSKDGRDLEYDILITIPTHRAPRVILESGLGDSQGWIDVDPRTLEMTGAENVYVIGDATNLHLKGVSKAGSAAHYQSEIIAQNIVQELNGLKPNGFYDGKVFCFIETGLNEATCIQFDYATPPTPPPPSTLLHWFKLSFNELYWAAVRGIL